MRRRWWTASALAAAISLGLAVGPLGATGPVPPGTCLAPAAGQGAGLGAGGGGGASWGPGATAPTVSTGRCPGAYGPTASS